MGILCSANNGLCYILSYRRQESENKGQTGSGKMGIITSQTLPEAMYGYSEVKEGKS
jgi:hypothetical protein